MVIHSLSFGQQQARERWNTRESGAAFDRKKFPYLIRQAQDFLMQQSFCVIAGSGPDQELAGLLAPGRPGFVQILDQSTFVFQFERQFMPARLLEGLSQALEQGEPEQLAFCFICHPTRERLCVQGSASLLARDGLNRLSSHTPFEQMEVRVQVREAFFHCTKYIKTRVAGLTNPIDPFLEEARSPQSVLDSSMTALTDETRAFIQKRSLCFLCTRNAQGLTAINHRGGAPGFLVTVPPEESTSGGLVLLPDYAGNGAFEAIGNILETSEAALLIPDYVAQEALCVSGSARVIDAVALSEDLTRQCKGAERVVALSVRRVEAQSGDWSATLAYERARAQRIWDDDGPQNQGCRI
jgi:hypothetical protein